MDDAWEALDVDDSDLPSLLRPSTLLPSKRQHSPLPPSPQQNPNKTNNTIFRSLEPCSQFPRPSQNQPKSNKPETLDSQSQRLTLPQFEKNQNDDPPSTSYQRLIPGPAGAVQATMNRKARSNRFGEDQIPTQEYIRRMNGEDEVENDEDFKRNSWLCAMEFLFNEKSSMGSSVSEGKIVLESNLSSTKTCSNIDRIPLVLSLFPSSLPSPLIVQSTLMLLDNKLLL